MKKPLIVLFTIITILTCKSQNEDSMDEIINEITNQLITYKQQPSYHANINSSACSFEFLINDMPVLSYYNSGGAAVSIPINPQILKSGLQTFKLKLYPGYYKENKQLVQTDSLTKDTKFNLAINLKDWNNSDEESKTVFEFSLPYSLTKSGIKEFELAGSPYFEFKGTFKAEVPYNLKGWKNSVDLTKENPKDIEIEVINTYNELINKFKNKDTKGIIDFNKTKAIEKLQSIYSTKRNEVSNAINKYSIKFDNPDFHLKPLENYELHFFGNGKTVCLLRTDLKNKGEGVVRIGYTNKENKKRLSVLGYMFHRPTSDSPLVPIR